MPATPAVNASASDAANAAVVFFDVDGTLVWDRSVDDPENSIVDLVPTPAVYDAFERLRDRGHKAFICTGRTLDSIGKPLLSLKSAGIISGAGACVSIDGEILAEQSIPVELLEETVRHLVALRVEVVFEGARESVALMRPGAVYRAIPGVPTVHDLEGLRRVAPAMDFEKFAFFADAIPALKRDADFFLTRYDLCDLGIGLGEMSLAGVNKGSGVQRALEVLGQAPDGGSWRTYAFGDSENDLPMLRAVDVPVAMGNALPQVKAMATYVTDRVEQDGVATGLAHFGLI